MAEKKGEGERLGSQSLPGRALPSQPAASTTFAIFHSTTTPTTSLSLSAQNPYTKPRYTPASHLASLKVRILPPTSSQRSLKATYLTPLVSIRDPMSDFRPPKRARKTLHEHLSQ